MHLAYASAMCMCVIYTYNVCVDAYYVKHVYVYTLGTIIYTCILIYQYLSLSIYIYIYTYYVCTVCTHTIMAGSEYSRTLCSLTLCFRLLFQRAFGNTVL